MLDPKLLNILSCPDCKSDVIYHRTGKNEELICSKCKRVFEVKNGIPLMLPKENA